MHFFFPGKTIGKICQQPIENQWEAILLPYVDSREYPELAGFAGNYVHRSCFESWPLKERMSGASFSLHWQGILSTESKKLLHVGDKMLVLKNIDSIIFKDFDLMLDLEISKDDGREMGLQWLEFFRNRKIDSKFKGSKYGFAYESGDLHVSTYLKGELIFNVIIPGTRLGAWISALESLLEPV